MKYFDRFFQPAGWQEQTFTAQDGAVIRYGCVPAQGAAKGTVILTTGYGDSLDAYYETMQDFSARGYDVWIMDWAGQGGSKGRKDSAVSLDDHAAHLRHFRQNIVTPATGPIILASHSMGGQVALNYLQAWPQDFDGAILAAPLVAFGLSPMAQTVLHHVFKTAVNMGLRDAAIGQGRADIQRQSADTRKKLRQDRPVRVDLHRTFFMLARPLGAEDPTVGLIDSLFKSTLRMNSDVVLRGIAAPVLLGVAGMDHIVNNDAIRRAAAQMPQGRLVELPESGHNIWQETSSVTARWWQAVDGFLAGLQPAVPNRKPPVP